MEETTHTKAPKCECQVRLRKLEKELGQIGTLKAESPGHSPFVPPPALGPKAHKAALYPWTLERAGV